MSPHLCVASKVGVGYQSTYWVIETENIGGHIEYGCIHSCYDCSAEECNYQYPHDHDVVRWNQFVWRNGDKVKTVTKAGRTFIHLSSLPTSCVKVIAAFFLCNPYTRFLNARGKPPIVSSSVERWDSINVLQLFLYCTGTVCSLTVQWCLHV